MKIEGIVMGVGAPNDTKKAGKTMCAIILTHELGFIRIYPIPAIERFPVWSTVSLEIENGNDPRANSYRLLNWTFCSKIEDANQKREILNECVIKSGTTDPMDYQNINRQSIFLTKMEWGNLEGTISQKVPHHISENDEEWGWIVTQGKHWHKPYIRWSSQQGKTHLSHLGGREVYEGLRNNPSNPWNLMNNLQINNPDYEIWGLMGNQKDHQNVWLCVHLHRLKKSMSGSIPLFSHPIIGKTAAWPYEKQQTTNVLIVDNHPELFTMNDMTFPFNRGNLAMAN
jgi:hypothetical protein